MQNMIRLYGRRLIAGLIGVALLLLVVAGPGAGPSVLAESGDLIVVVWPVPSVQVARGDLLVYQVQAKNFNRSAKNNIRVYLPYDAQQLTIMGAETEQRTDWISELSSSHVLVTFDELGGSQSRTVTIYAQVADDLPDGTVINMWPSYSWSDSRTQKRARSANAAPVVVGAANAHSASAWLAVEPARAPVGTTFGFFTNRLLPGEPVEVALLNAVGQRQPLDIAAQVDGQGQVWLEVAPSDVQIPPGFYQLAVRGMLSNLEALATFEVAPS